MSWFCNTIVRFGFHKYKLLMTTIDQLLTAKIKITSELSFTSQEGKCRFSLHEETEAY